MLTTGLVSLNIHEALAFDGTEIVLHPELFAADGHLSVNSLNASIRPHSSSIRPVDSSSIRPCPSAATGVSSNGSISGLAADSNNNNNKDTTTSTSAQQGAAPSSSPQGGCGASTASSHRLLEVGDMIEIRVWDPLPARDRHQSPVSVSTVFRKRSNASVHSAQSSTSASTDAPKSITSKKSALMSPPTSQGKISNAFSAGSMQYSTDFSSTEHASNADHATMLPPISSKSLGLASSADTADNVANNLSPVTGASPSPVEERSKDTETLSPTPSSTKNVLTGKPPRGDAPRMPAPSSTSSLNNSKPPLQPRANNTTSTHAVEQTFLQHDGRNIISHSIKRHSREISDMTADSVMVAAAAHTIGLLNNPPAPPPPHHVDDTISVPIIDDITDHGHDHDDNRHEEEEEDDDDDDHTLSLIGKTHTMRFSFVMLVTPKTLTSLKGSARTQVSMLRQVADLYKLSPYDMVTINRIEKSDEPAVLKAVSADFVLVSIKDQFISRGDMHLFQKQLIGSWIYEGQRLKETARGIKAHAWLIRHGKRQAKSGIVTEDTTITFRSRSSRIFWLVQISAEMWDYASPYERERGEENESVCEIYFDKWISFVHRLFDKWKALEVTHSLTVVFFSRTFLSSRQAITVNAKGGSLDCKDVYGRPYEDHYKTVIENETKADWESLVIRLKQEFLRYPLEVGWNLSTGDLGRRPSNASQGNVLEAINVTSNLLQFHYLDRDLHRTGNSIVVISPGCGVFEVDKGLASITYQRMMDNGIGTDVLSLGLPPLHIAPFFLYNNEYHTVESRGVDTSETYYEIPHWMHLAFVSYESESDNASQIPARATETELTVSKKFIATEKPLPVAANGFILPRKEESSDPTIPTKVKVDPSSPTSFSVNGIAASSPQKLQKKLPQERALNEGRDFLDILEACRPRNSGTIPSALQAILKMFRRCEKFDLAPSDSVNEDTEDGDTDELKPLREWTSMDLDLDEQPYKVTRPRSGSFGLNERSSERSDSSVLSSSPGSSYASLVGVSFDKHLLGRQKGGAPLGGVHLQRSQSLQVVSLDPNDDTESVKSGGSSWSTTLGPEGSVGAGTDDDLTSSRAAQKERSRHAQMLRKIQAQHDSSYFDAPQLSMYAATEPAQSRPPPFLHDPVQTLSPVAGITMPSHRRNESSQSGLGAALTHYTISHDAANDNPSNRIRVLNPNVCAVTEGMGPRTASLGLATRSSQWASGGRPMSPLLLPPPGMPAVSLADAPEIIRPEDRNLSSRLLPRVALSSRDGGSSKSLNTGYSGRGLPNHLITPVGELFAEQRRIDSTGGIKSLGGGSPRNADLYRGSHGRKGERDKHGHRHRDSSTSHRHARKKVFNPFRQADEDKVLAKRSHNRRRWSHVFPKGETEFKRHAGPNWKSLTSPAILPLSVDYFPSRQEIDQFFQFNIYNVTLSDFENANYLTHRDFLMEMLRQRISQDYQLVPPSCVDDTFRFTRPMMGHAPIGSRGGVTSVIPNLTAERSDNQKTIKHFLTMGHQLQELTYDPNTDTIEVVRFNEKSAQNDKMNTFKYEYLVYESLTQKYTKVVQTFTKYANQYNWNKVDRIICGDEDKTLRDGMRFRRVTFGLIPPKFSTPGDEKEYIAKFKRLSEYLCKLKETDSTIDDIKVISTNDDQPDLFETKTVTGVASMRRSTVQLRKKKHDPFEWIELATDTTFSTLKSYHVLFHWLAATPGKVDTQIQLLHRRCTQYGLSLTVFPQTSISRDLLLNPFKAPPTFCIRDDEKAKLLYTSILELDFVNDGVFYTQTRPILECIENGDEFDFGRRLSTAARQFVHRSGTLFVRLIRDRRGWVIVVVIPNGFHIKKDEERREATAKLVFRDLSHLIGSMGEDE